LLYFVITSAVSSNLARTVASTLIWDAFVPSTDSVHETVSSALGCWLRLAPGAMTADELDICLELAMGEWVSVFFYILFYYLMSERDGQEGRRRRCQPSCAYK
jgi:hypothetical protein